MSVKTHEAFSLDSFQDRLLWYDDFLGDQLKDEWTSTGDVGGSAVVVDAQTGGIVRITTDGDDTDNWEINWNNIRSLLVTKKVTMEFRLKLTQTAAVRPFVGLGVDGVDGAFFLGLGTDWWIRCRNGAAITEGDSGENFDTDYHIFRIECFPTDEVHFYIDDVECDNSPITTNIPVNYMQPWLYIITSENVEKSMDIDYVAIRQEI